MQGSKGNKNWIDLIRDNRHLCKRSRIDGIQATLRGILGGKQASEKMSQYE